MKKLFLVLAATTLILASCASATPKNDGGGTADLPKIEGGPADIGNEIIEIDLCDWHSSWANWTDDERVTQGIVNPDTVSHTYPRKHLPLYKIDSTEELAKFIEDYGEVFALDYRFGGNLGAGFKAATDHCDAEFFEEKLILAAYVEAPSGSFRYGVRNAVVDNGTLTLEVEQTNDPEVHTDDMSGWLVAAEILRTPISDCTSFDAVYVGVKGREELPEGINDPDLSEPPTLAVITPDASIKASMGTSSWFYPVGDGTDAAKMYDSSHPASKEFIDVMPRLSNDKYYDVTGGVYAKLAFDFYRMPEITIKRWARTMDCIASFPDRCHGSQYFSAGF